ncbi:hypothetical protein ACIPL1_24745 [Pseudomonas sp. NPDC090202]|uniref:hypothetical protein n=1 Tax=Pseudomonas sp. NPDC090202 TaxID=3364476 RepID=UPI0037FB71E9
MPTVNEVLQEAAVGHAVDLQGLSNAQIKELVSLLNTEDPEIKAQILAAIEKMDGKSYSDEYMLGVMALLLVRNKAAYAKVGKALKQAVADQALYELKFQHDLLQNVLPAGEGLESRVVMPGNKAVVGDVLAAPYQGQTIDSWIASLEASRAAKIRNTIRAGVAAGRDAADIVKELVGTKSQGFADGVLNRDRNDLATIVATVVGGVAQSTAEAFASANDELIRCLLWISVLDNRTSAECQARSEKLYRDDKERTPIGHNIPWLAGPGMLHHRCRSSFAVVLRSWKELGLGADTSDAVKTALDGEAPKQITYGQWITNQPPEVQDSVLGAERGQLLRSGALTVNEFVNNKGRLLTLSELQRRHAKAFEDAGLNRFKQPTSDFTIYDVGYPVSKPDVSTPARAKAVEIESGIRLNSFETGAFIDKNGNVLLQRSGEADKVAFPVSEFSRLKDSVFTHNHPGNRTFSRADVNLAAEIGVAELRAVGPTLRYIMTADKGWPSSDIITSLTAEAEEDAVAKAIGMFSRGEIERDYMHAEAENQYWKILSERVGLKYTRERS